MAKTKTAMAKTAVAKTRTALAYGIEVRESRIDGKGCFAVAAFRRRGKVAELTGERVARVEAARRMRGKRRLHICAIDSYWGVDSSRGGNGTQYVNHCCEPNCFMRVTRGHIIIYALRDILPGEELTLDYGVTYHPNTKRCLCGAASCRGTLNNVRKGRG